MVGVSSHSARTCLSILVAGIRSPIDLFFKRCYSSFAANNLFSKLFLRFFGSVYGWLGDVSDDKKLIPFNSLGSMISNRSVNPLRLKKFELL